ncbi:CLUMA_CG000529, isoform A [Clunio marinus]|uniref:CLUMA_CG000529, isoform A n=1 Tax=Clunio marinus TaxID=568069 RepID=A0A1J1HFD1_9DIPT|nr:CLUMA_CG000529, isoform A [Clunio marinus]
MGEEISNLTLSCIVFNQISTLTRIEMGYLSSFNDATTPNTALIHEKTSHKNQTNTKNQLKEENKSEEEMKTKNK